MKKVILLLMIVFLVWASRASAENNASDFLRTGTSARAIGMGSAYTAIADHIDGVFFNPAGLAVSVHKMELSSSAVNNFDEVNRGNLGYAARLSQLGLNHNTVLGLNLSNSQVTNIPRTEWEDDRPKTVDTFDSIKNNQTFTYSLMLDWYWHVGANLRHYNYEIDRYKAEALGFDVGILHRLPNYYFGHFIVIGATLHNVLNTQVHWSTGHTDAMPMRLNFGGAMYGKLFDRRYIISTEFGFEGQDKVTLHSGIEYWLLKDMFVLRCGSDDGAFTVGTGLKVYDFSIDYAQADYKELGVIQRLSLGMQF
ncbi:MAG: PorV/PorQ family protein [Candidatus Margulisbacteria bacterium]|nr:PorV/PorQ family protein [Candidatus Margulisiibacteriota bacterium]